MGEINPGSVSTDELGRLLDTNNKASPADTRLPALLFLATKRMRLRWAIFRVGVAQLGR